jgi:steroid delta-isomerase-like uncharacterized protein
MSDAATHASAISDQFAREWMGRFLGAWHSHEPEQLVALSAEDVLWEDPFIYPSGALRGHDDLRAWLRSVFRAFPDVTFDVVGEPFVSLDRERIAAHWTAQAHMSGPLDPPGFAPTMGELELSGVDIHEFRDGRLSHVVTITDVSTVARQIGAMPPAGSFGEKLGVGLQKVTAKLRTRQQQSQK